MAAECIFTCPVCGFKVAYWDEGKSYIAGPDGQRHYWYHPGEHLQWLKIFRLFVQYPTEADISNILREHGGTEDKHLCRACCGTTFLDLRKDTLNCRHCGSAELILVSQLAGQGCPTCHRSRFGAQRYGAIG